MVNLEIVKKNIESFIMPFQIPTDICDELINYFKTTKYNKIDTTESGWSTDVKQGIDLSIQPDTNIPIINDYLHCMKDGVELSKSAMKEGLAQSKLESYVKMSNNL